MGEERKEWVQVTGVGAERNEWVQVTGVEEKKRVGAGNGHGREEKRGYR